MKNFIQSGDTLTWAAPYTVASGAGCLLGALFGVAVADVASGDEGEFSRSGVFQLAKTTSQAWTKGVTRLYWNDSTKKVTSDGSAGLFIGVCAESALSADTTGAVVLGGVGGAELVEGPQPTIAALTDSSGGATADGTIGAVTLPTTLTGSSTGTANGALEAEGALSTSGGNTYSDAAVNTVIGKLENNIAELVARQTENLAAITALRDAVKELSSGHNAVLAALKVAGIIASS